MELAQYLHLKDKGRPPFLYLMYVCNVCTIRIRSLSKTKQKKNMKTKKTFSFCEFLGPSGRN